MSFCGFSRPRARRGLQRISRGISATAGTGLIIINPASVADFWISYTAASPASRIFATCDTIIIIFHVTLILYVSDEFEYNIIRNRIVL